MAGKKGTNAPKESFKAVVPGRQQNLFHFYQRQSERKEADKIASVVDAGTALSECSESASEARQSLPKEGKDNYLSDSGLSSQSLQPNKMSHRIFERRVTNDSSSVLQDSHETQLSGGFSRADEDEPKRDAPKKQSLQRHITRSQAASVVSRQLVDPLAHPKPKTSPKEQGVEPSTKPPPRKSHAIFENRRLAASSQSVPIPNDTGPADQHPSLPSGRPLIPKVKHQIDKSSNGTAFGDVVDLVDLTEASSPPTRFPRLEHPILAAEDEKMPQAAFSGNRHAPIDLSSSPPAKCQSVKAMHPFFAPRMIKRIGPNDPGHSWANEHASCQMVVPWPRAGAQHSRGPQGTFLSSASSPFGRYRPAATSSKFASQPNLRFLNRSADTPPSIMESRVSTVSLHTATRTEREKLISSLPSSHRTHPGVSRLFDGSLDAAPREHVDEAWTHKWRPRRAAEVLGNEENTRYLNAWLQALAIRDEKLELSADDAKGQSTVQNKRQGSKRHTVVRAVDKKRDRKRRRVESDDGSSLGDWLVDEAEETESEGISEAESFLRRPSRCDQRASVSPSARARGEDVVNDARLDHHNGSHFPEFPTLTNTILLAGPPGSGKTSTVYACAEELGWEVFEVYPGIGRRSGGNVSSLVGEVGKNHIVGRYGTSGTTLKRHLMRPLFGHGADKGQNNTAGPENGKRTIQQSIILFEEVDILFKEDTNFWPTVVNLIKSSRRPVFMTCNDVSLVPQEDLPLQTCLLFQSCPPPLAVSFLQSVCLAEGYLVSPKQLEAMYMTTYEPLSSDEPDEPSTPFPSQPRPRPDLRRALNDLQFWCQRGVSPGGDEMIREKSRPFTEVSNITTSSWTEVFADWSRPPHGDTAEEIPTLEADISRLWKHSECASYADAYIERRLSDVLEALAIDRYSYSVDDEIGYTLLDKASPHENSTGLAFYSPDIEIAREALAKSRHVLEASGVGPRARAKLRGGSTLLIDSRSLMWGRVANQTQVASFLDDLIPLSGPLLPRPAAVLEYTPYVRQMVAADDAMKAEASERETRSHHGRQTRNRWQLGDYPRYITLSQGGLAAARETLLH